MSKLIIGWREWVSLPDLGISTINAKTDTGARTSALHVCDIEPLSTPFSESLGQSCCDTLSDRPPTLDLPTLNPQVPNPQALGSQASNPQASNPQALGSQALTPPPLTSKSPEFVRFRVCLRPKDVPTYYHGRLRARSGAKITHYSPPVIAPIIDRRAVRNSGGTSEIRFVIQTTLLLDRSRWSIELTLTDRAQMGFGMLLGREAMKKRMMVDPAASFLCDPRRLRSAN